MKIYKHPEPPYLMRINITKQGAKKEFLTICETTQKECYIFIKKIIEAQNISPFQSGRITNIAIREAKGTNGKAVSLSFKGLEPIEVKELILKELTK